MSIICDSVSSIISSSSGSEETVRNCSALVDSILDSPNSRQRFTEFLDAILVDSVSVGVSRKLISNVVSKVKCLPTEVCLTYYDILTEALKMRLMSFEDQVTEVNQHMAELYESQDNHIKAAYCLSAIPLENSQKNYSKNFTTQMYLKIAHLFIEGRDTNQAEMYINRASLLITSGTEPSIQVNYKLCYAKVLDFRKKFLEAARRYLELSLETSLSASEQTELLSHAVLCAIIAPAGLHRSRLLSSLSKDERSQHFIFHGMLKNMTLGHLITNEQVQLFEKELLEHQKAKLPNGMSILEAAVMEHNVMAVSNIYKSIKIDNLSDLLRVPALQAERVVGKMIAEQRISGHIDQIEQIVFFKVQSEPWDEHISVICSKVNNVIDILSAKEPEFTKQRLQHYGC